MSEDCGPTTFEAWCAAWLGAAVIGVANGTARDLLYRDRLGEAAAQRVSTATLLAALTAYAAALQRLRPIPTAGTAWRIGAAWSAATVAFEFGFGHWVARESWSDLARNYDVRTGRLWALVPVAMATLPASLRVASPSCRR